MHRSTINGPHNVQDNVYELLVEHLQSLYENGSFQISAIAAMHVIK